MSELFDGVVVSRMKDDEREELSQALAELSKREPIFHHPEFGSTRADFEEMTVPDFWEVGASGRIYSKAEVVDILERRYAAPHEDVWEASDFRCRKLAPNLYLLTYMLVQDNVRRSRRATIWQRTAAGWKIVYHQGTLIQD